jgi:hypothetical protein
MLTTTQQFSMTLGIAAVGTLFFAREASAGIVSALQAGLYADTALVAFALVMTLFLPRTATTRSAAAPALAEVGTEDLAMTRGRRFDRQQPKVAHAGFSSDVEMDDELDLALSPAPATNGSCPGSRSSRPNVERSRTIRTWS